MSYEYNPKSNVVFGNVDLSDYNAYAVYCNIFDRPERDISVVSVPGRNGDLIFDNGRYKNVDRIYQIHVVGVENVHSLIRDLTSTIGYQRLEDEYDPNVYMMARLKSKPNVQRFVGNAVLITVTFDRMPQKWVKDETPIESGTLHRMESRQGGPSISYMYGKVAYVYNNDENNKNPIIKISNTYAGYQSGSYLRFDIFRRESPCPEIEENGSLYWLEGDFYDQKGLISVPNKYCLMRITLYKDKEGWPDAPTNNYVIDSENQIVYNDDTKTNLISAITNYVSFPMLKLGPNYIYVISSATGYYNQSFTVDERDWSL